MTWLNVIVIVSGVGTIYSYFLYPVLLMILSKRPQPILAQLEDLPGMTVIVACFNEELQLAEKLNDILDNGYPVDRLQVIVTSDQSTDGTHAIAESFSDRGIELVVSPARKGKENAQGLALMRATGDVIVFTDAGARMSDGALRQIAVQLNSPTIGAVSSHDLVLTADGQPAGEGLYQRYEMWLRRLECERSTLIGLTGALFAAKRHVCTPWDSTVDSDFGTALNCIRHDLIAVTDPTVRCIYHDLGDDRREYARKVRTVLRGLDCVVRNRGMLNPLSRPLIAWQIWSHKIGRYIVPWCMAMLLISTCFLAIGMGNQNLIVRLMVYGLLAGQLLFYSIAVAGLIVPVFRKLKIVRAITFFSMANIAVAHAGALFLFGRRVRVWDPSARTNAVQGAMGDQ